MSRLKSPVLLLVVASGASVACSLLTSKNVQTALDIAKVLCIVANAESDDQTVKTICHVVDAENDAFRAVLSEQRMASRRYASRKASCGDAGVR